MQGGFQGGQDQRLGNNNTAMDQARGEEIWRKKNKFEQQEEVKLAASVTD